MKATCSTTCVQESSLLSRTPKEAETVRPLAQIASKPASSTMRADNPSWASMRKAMSGRVTMCRSWVVVRTVILPSGANGRAESIAELMRGEGNATHGGFFRRDLGEDEVRALAGESALHRLRDGGSLRDRGHRPVACRLGEAVEANLARDGALASRGAVDLVVEHHVHEARGAQGGGQGKDAEVHQEIAVAVQHYRGRAPIGDGEAEADGRGKAHRADHVEVLTPVAQREGLAAHVAVGVHDGLAADALAGGGDGVEARKLRVERRWERRGARRLDGRRATRCGMRRSVPRLADLHHTRRHQERYGLHQTVHRLYGPREIGLQRVRGEHPMGDLQELEEPRRDLAGEDVLGSVLAPMTAPGHHEEGG